MKPTYNKKKFALVLEKLLDGTLDGIIERTRIGKQYHWSYPPTKNGWEWHIAEGSVHIGHLTKDTVYFSVFNSNNVEVIDNKYDKTDIEHPVVRMYNHIQDAYDKMGAELIDNLIENLNNL